MHGTWYGSPYIYRGPIPYHVPILKLIHNLMKTLRTILSILLSQVVSILVFGMAVGYDIENWTTFQIIIYIVMSAYYYVTIQYAINKKL